MVLIKSMNYSGTDIFPNNGLILLPDTVEMSLGGTKLNEDKYTLNKADDGSYRGFKIVVNTEINQELKVTYKTSFDPQKEVEGEYLIPHSNQNELKKYRNDAEFEGETENGISIETDARDEKDISQVAWAHGKKEGRRVHEGADGKLVEGWVGGKERKLAWQIYVNHNAQKLSPNVVILDNLQYDGAIDPKSIAIYKYEVEPNGDIKIDPEPVTSTVKFNKELSEDKKILKITFTKEISDRYVIEYTTTVPDISLEEYKNNVSFTSTEINKTYEGINEYERYDKYIDKKAHEANNKHVYTGDILNWEVNLNETLSVIEKPVITDTMSDGHVYVKGSLKVELDGVELVEGEDYVTKPSEDTNIEVFETPDLYVELVKKANETIPLLTGMLTLTYQTIVITSRGEITNAITLRGSVEEISKNEQVTYTASQFSFAGGEWGRPSNGALSITKVDENNNAVKDKPAKFKLWYKLDGKDIEHGEFETDKEGLLKIGNLPLRDYELEEVEAPEGYQKLSHRIPITVDKLVGSDKENPNWTEITVKNYPLKEISVTKVWKDEENKAGVRPAKITLNLLQDSELLETKELDETSLNADGNWVYTFKGLDSHKLAEGREEGEEYKYEVKEVSVPGYESSIAGTANDGYTITNTLRKMSIPFKKTWLEDEKDLQTRPESLKIYLDRKDSNETVSTIDMTINEKNQWSGEFKDLLMYDEFGNPFVYTLREEVPAGYTRIDTPKEITEKDDGDFQEIENRLLKSDEIGFTKKWVDSTDTSIRPKSITIDLYRGIDGKEYPELYQTVVMNTETGMEQNGVFEKLPEKNKNGKPYFYQVRERDVVGYESNVNSENSTMQIITNTLETSELEVKKEWNDASDISIRPDEITIDLYRHVGKAEPEEFQQGIKLSAENNWEYVFAGLSKVNQSGEPFIYTIKEHKVPGYRSKIEGYTITNTLELTEFKVEKQWEDLSNKFGLRPNEIQLSLLKFVEGKWLPVEKETMLASGKSQKTPVQVVLSSQGKWEATFDQLTKFDKYGEEVRYAVKEEKVDAYKNSSMIEVNNQQKVTITNQLETIDIPVEKIWKDIFKGEENYYKSRPESITVRLKQNGEELTQVPAVTIKGNETENWQYVFNNLPKYNANGEEYEYTVTEDAVDKYNQNITGTGTDGFTIINTFKTYAIGDYTWVDTDRDGFQDPEEPVLPGVMVELYDKDGNKIAETTTDENGYYIFDELESGDYQVKFILTPEQAKIYQFTDQNAGPDNGSDSDANPQTGWTVTIRINEKNQDLTKDYTTQSFKATEGIDPTWDAGVVLKEKVIDSDDENNKPSGEVEGSEDPNKQGAREEEIVKPTNPKKPQAEAGKKIPQLGEELPLSFGLIGLAMVSSAFAIWTFRRRRAKK